MFHILLKFYLSDFIGPMKKEFEPKATRFILVAMENAHLRLSPL